MVLELKDIKELATKIKSLGGRLFLVGGYPRDLLMGLPSKDFDCEVYGIEPSKLKSTLETFAKTKEIKLNLVGESFQVIKLGLNTDISLPRRDRKVGQGHKGFEIEGDPFMSTFEASRRRDLTIGAMLLDPLTEEIIDHFGGQSDIKFKTVKLVDAQTFTEDSLRALRAVQFASRFGFEISPRTKEVIKTMDLKDLPRERLWMEFEKWLMLSPKPSVGLFLMRELGILEKLFPELYNLTEVPQDVRYHPEGDVFVHTALALDEARTVIAGLPYPEQVTVMLATLFHDLGKVETTRVFFVHEDGTECDRPETCFGCGVDVEERVTAHGHAEAGVSLARNMLDRFALHSIEGYDVRTQVLALVENHMKPFEFHRNPPKDSAFRRLALKVDLKLLHKVCHSDAFSRNKNDKGMVFGTGGQDWFLDKIENLEIPPKGPEKILLGRHLIEMGVKPGKEMGEIVATVFDMQLEGTVTNLIEAKVAAKLLLTARQERTKLGV